MSIPTGRRSDRWRIVIIASAWLAFILASTGNLASRPQTQSVQASSLTWTTYANGDDVRALALDGNIVWAGTQGGGVVRWDPGAGTFTQYLRPNTGLIGNDVRDIAIDREGNRWFATNHGVSRLSPEGQWTAYTKESTATDSGVWLNSDNATAIAATEDELGKPVIWIGLSQEWDGNGWAGGGIVRLDRNGWTAWDANHGIASNNVTDIAIDSTDGRVWVTTRPHRYWDATLGQWQSELGGISIFDAGNWFTVRYDPNASSSWPKSNDVRGVAIDIQGNKWFATCQRGLNVLQGSDPADASQWKSFQSSNSGLPTDVVVAVAADPSRTRIWAATASQCYPVTNGRGVSLLDYGSSVDATADDQWSQFNSSNGLPSDTVRAILVPPDQAGRDEVWLGTSDPAEEDRGDGFGIVRLNVSTHQVTRWSTVEQGSLPSNYITVIAQGPDNRIWVGTRKRGAAVWDGSTWRWYSKANTGGALPSDRIRGIAFEDPNRVWFATEATEVDNVLRRWKDGGVSMLEGDTWRELWTLNNSYARGDQVTAVASLTMVGYNTVETNFPNREAALQALDPGYVMFGGDDTLYSLSDVFTSNTGMTTLKIAPGLQHELPMDTPVYNVRLGLGENRTTAIAVAYGKLWVGTGGLTDHQGYGLSVFDLASRTWQTPLRYPQIASDLVLAIAPDVEQNRLWLATTYAHSHQTGDVVGGGVSLRDGETWSTPYSNGILGFLAYLNDVRSIAAGNGGAWAGAFNWTGPATELPSDWYGVDTIVNHFDGGWTNEVVAKDSYVSALAVDGNRLWVATSRDGRTEAQKPYGQFAPAAGLKVKALDTGTWYAYATANSDLSGDDLQAIALTRNGERWFGSYRHGISVLQAGDLPATATPMPTATEGSTPAPTPQGTQSISGTATPTVRRDTGILVLTATPTPLGTPGPTPTSEPIPPSEVPEAETIILLGSGLAGLAGYARLRYRARNRSRR